MHHLGHWVLAYMVWSVVIVNAYAIPTIMGDWLGDLLSGRPFSEDPHEELLRMAAHACTFVLLVPLQQQFPRAVPLWSLSLLAIMALAVGTQSFRGSWVGRSRPTSAAAP